MSSTRRGLRGAVRRAPPQPAYGQVRERFAYVEQETPVVPGTIRDNLVRRPTHHRDRTCRSPRHRPAHRDLAELPDGPDTSLISSAVSGGQRRRIAMDRALLRRADVLLLDEATSQADGRTEVAVHQAISASATSGQ
ncbi:ATP-binding cassette domain-containing protein [Streptomyces sp. NPDC060184]|uniref:ATP-binding cassette domain-containing protein n=1 Tax=Streptomyces sp. NPDC060184 TaxID=3347064 RepID=UPI003658A0E7